MNHDSKFRTGGGARNKRLLATFAVAIFLISSCASMMDVAEADTVSNTGKDSWSCTITIPNNTASGDGSLNVTYTKNGDHVDVKAVNGLERYDQSKLDGSWGFDTTTGYGPFNSFYAAFDTSGKMICHLDPYNLCYTLDKKSAVNNVNISDCNIMWCIPQLYMTVDEDFNSITLSSSGEKKDIAKAFIITEGSDDESEWTYYNYLAIGVYEATHNIKQNLLGSCKNNTYMLSGQYANGGVTARILSLDENRTYAHNNDTSNDVKVSMLWNFYQWQLYRMCSLAVMGGFDSQKIVGWGNVSGDTYSSAGQLDRSYNAQNGGPYFGYAYAEGTSYSVKLFIENAWGSVAEYLDDVYVDDDGKLYAGQNSTPTTDTADKKVIASSGWIATKPAQYINFGTYPYVTSLDMWGLPTAYVNQAESTSAAPDAYPTLLNNGHVVSVGGDNNKYGSSRIGLSQYGLAVNKQAGYGTRVTFLFDTDPTVPKTVKITLDDKTNSSFSYTKNGATTSTTDDISVECKSLTISGNKITLPSGDTIEVKGSNSHVFDQWKSGTSKLSDGSPSLSEGMEIKAYVFQGYSLKILDGGHGRIKPTTSEYYLDPDSSITLIGKILSFTPHGANNPINVEFIPSSGYRFVTFENYTEGMTISSDLILTAKCNETVTLTLKSESSSKGNLLGSPSVSGLKYTVDKGTELDASTSGSLKFSALIGGSMADVTVTATGKESNGFRFSGWDSTAKVDTTRDVTALFNQYKVSFESSNAAQGTVNSTEAWVTAGATLSLNGSTLSDGVNDLSTAIANAGYGFSYWGSSTGRITDSDTVTTPKTYYAHFQDAYAFTISATDGTIMDDSGSSTSKTYYVIGGTELTPGTDGSKGTLTFDAVVDGITKSVTVSAEGNDGYAFSEWSDTSTIDSAKSISASFIQAFELRFPTVEGGSLIYSTGSGAYVVMGGTTITYSTTDKENDTVSFDAIIGGSTVRVTVTASADSGYDFTGWGSMPSTVSGSVVLTPTFVANSTEVVTKEVEISSEDELIDALDTPEKKTIKIVDNMKITVPVTVPSGTTLEISQGKTIISSGSKVTVDDGARFTIGSDASIVNKGTIENNGSFVNNGGFVNQGKIILDEGVFSNSGKFENDGGTIKGGDVINGNPVINTTVTTDDDSSHGRRSDDQLIVPFAVGAIASLLVVIVFWIKKMYEL